MHEQHCEILRTVLRYFQWMLGTEKPRQLLTTLFFLFSCLPPVEPCGLWFSCFWSSPVALCLRTNSTCVWMQNTRKHNLVLRENFIFRYWMLMSFIKQQIKWWEADTITADPDWSRLLTLIRSSNSIKWPPFPILFLVCSLEWQCMLHSQHLWRSPQW